MRRMSDYCLGFLEFSLFGTEIAIEIEMVILV